MKIYRSGHRCACTMQDSIK